jgi:glycosyltransferase involved in cell wall biosynthesis
MLEGRGAFQEEALGELINWLRGLGRIDLVHISNALLLHPAERIKAELSLPIVVSLQDEDSWIDGLPEGRRPQAWDILARKAAAADVFIASSAYFAERMRLALRLSADSVRVVYPGIRAAEYRLGEPGRHDIGYLSRICQRMGFGILARAYALLRRMPGLSDLRMSASGGGGAQDARFLAQTKRFLRAEGCEDGLTLRAAFDKVARVDFLAGLGLLSVPAPAGEAFGAFQLEAMAAGLPLVQPRAGGFVEAIEEAGCGILTEDAEPESLAAGIERVLGDQALARALGERGRKAVETVFSDRAMAEATLAAYTRAIEAGGGRKV